MRDAWLTLVGSVLRPARPHLERCLLEREQYLAARRRVGEERAHAIARCEAHIESARAAVFSAKDGVVPSRMTELEREWRRLSRPDPDFGLMDLWARVAPASWLDRKRWRDSEPARRLDAAIALAADPDGVLAAEAAIESLGVALAAWGTPIGPRARWRAFERDAELTASWLDAPLRAARAALTVRGAESAVLARARRLERDVDEALRVRLPDRASLARDVAYAAFVDFVWRAASLDERPNPVTSLRAVWGAGYAVSAIDASGVTLEIPPL